MTNIDASYNTTAALVVNERCEVIAFAWGWSSAWSVSVLSRAFVCACVFVHVCACIWLRAYVAIKENATAACTL